MWQWKTKTTNIKKWQNKWSEGASERDSMNEGKIGDMKVE